MSRGLFRRGAQRVWTRAAASSTCAHTHTLSLSHTHTALPTALHRTPASLPLSLFSTNAVEGKTVTATHRRIALDLSRVYVGQTLDNIDETTGQSVV
jgi:hypothetical protein